jgi:hypothetical protein
MVFTNLHVPYGKLIITNNGKSSVFTFKNPLINGNLNFSCGSRDLHVVVFQWDKHFDDECTLQLKIKIFDWLQVNLEVVLIN